MQENVKGCSCRWHLWRKSRYCLLQFNWKPSLNWHLTSTRIHTDLLPRCLALLRFVPSPTFKYQRSHIWSEMLNEIFVLTFPLNLSAKRQCLPFLKQKDLRTPSTSNRTSPTLSFVSSHSSSEYFNMQQRISRWAQAPV